MIAVQDLMIGDWVLHDGEPYQIRQLGIYGENRDGEDYPAVCVGKPKGIGLIVERYEIESIPLTAEILEKNGFKKPTLNDPELINYVFKASFEHKSPLPNVEILRVNYYDGVEWDFYALLGERKSSDCGEQYEYVIIIKYVHELQHALRLAGIEKTIEL